MAKAAEQYRMDGMNAMPQWNRTIRHKDYNASSDMGPPLMGSMLADPVKRQQLMSLLGPAVRFDEPMARHTAFRIGGPADAMAEPETQAQLRQLVHWAIQEQVPYMVVGKGTNLLVKDGGVRGLVIRLNRLATEPDWTVDGDKVRLKVGLGLPTKTICALALRQGWQGMNFAVGIPGHLGGAVAMNAGSHLGSMADVITGLRVLTAQARFVILDATSISWGYRRCELPSNLVPGAILVEAELLLTAGDKENLRAQALSAMKNRAVRQPMGIPCAGSFFKNPAADRAAGRLIEEAGLKGLTVGNAKVSPKHANFIVNLGGATAEDVLRLKDQIQTTVWQQFAIDLIPEVHIVGEAIKP